MEKTTSWVEFCNKLHRIDECIKDTENSAYTTRYCNTKEDYRTLQVGKTSVQSQMADLLPFGV